MKRLKIQYNEINFLFTNFMFAFTIVFYVALQFSPIVYFRVKFHLYHHYFILFWPLEVGWFQWKLDTIYVHWYYVLWLCNVFFFHLVGWFKRSNARDHWMSLTDWPSTVLWNGQFHLSAKIFHHMSSYYVKYSQVSLSLYFDSVDVWVEILDRSHFFFASASFEKSPFLFLPL